MSFENDLPNWRSYKDGKFFMKSVPSGFWSEFEGLAQKVEDENLYQLISGLAAVIRYGLTSDTFPAALMNELYNIRTKIQRKVNEGNFPLLMDSLSVFIRDGRLSCDEINSYLGDHGIGYVCVSRYASRTVQWKLREEDNIEYEEESRSEIAPSYKNDTERFKADKALAERVLKALIAASNEVCNNAHYHQYTDENTINDYYVSLLRMKGYVQVSDQTRHGISYSENSAGSVDILLREGDREIAIIEAFRLKYLDISYINEHIHKAIINYNALGTPTFLLIYMGASDFSKLWDRVSRYISEYDFKLEVVKEVSPRPDPNAALRLAECVLSRDGFDFPVIFLAVNVYKKMQSHSRSAKM